MNDYDFGLPDIEEGINLKEREHRLKYKNLYIKLINRCKNMTKEELSGYNEKHHILPRCLNGNDLEENLIVLPVRYHVMAHLILFEIYPNNYKLAFTVNMMTNGSNSGVQMGMRTESINHGFSSRLIASYREKAKKMLSEYYSGSKNPNSQRVISPDGIVFNGIKEASEISGIPYSTLTKWLEGEISNHGWKFYGDNSHKRVYKNRNLEKSSKKIIDRNNKIYNSIKEASLENKIPYTTLRYWLSGRTRDNHGWKYLLSD